MTIKEVSEMYGLSQETLRYYERIGIIPAVTRTSSGIRNYEASDLQWVALAADMKRMSLPIEVMLKCVQACSESEEIPKLQPEILEDHRRHLLEKREEIDENLKQFEKKLEGCLYIRISEVVVILRPYSNLC